MTPEFPKNNVGKNLNYRINAPKGQEASAGEGADANPVENTTPVAPQHKLVSPDVLFGQMNANVASVRESYSVASHLKGFDRVYDAMMKVIEEEELKLSPQAQSRLAALATDRFLNGKI